VLTEQHVFFNGKEATITSATATQLITSVPLRAGTGAVSIKFKDGKTIAGPVFNYKGTLLVNIFAGSGAEGFADGVGTAAIFKGPGGIAVDKTGNVFVCDVRNNRIRKITPDGMVTTFAGNGVKASIDGTGISASLDGPYFIAIDSTGNLFITESADNHIVRKITPNGVVSTYAGSHSGYRDGPANTAQFGTLYGINVDKDGNVYVCDIGTGHIRKITTDKVVSTIWNDLPNLKSPFQILIDHSNNFYVSNLSDETIRKITPAGVMTYVTNLDGTPNFKGLQGMTIDANDVIYVGDNSVIKKVVNDKVVSNFAGNLSLELPREGPAANVSIISPQGIAIDGLGNLYAAEALVNIICKISTQ
jgi:sugar lactone lactonase YvrE